MNSLKKGDIAQHLKTYSVPPIQKLTVVDSHKAKFNVGAGWLEAFATFETNEGRGRGFLRLQETAPGEWRAFTFFVRVFHPLFPIFRLTCPPTDRSLGDQGSRRARPSAPPDRR